MSAQSPKTAKDFFDELQRSEELQGKIKLGLESLVKIAAGLNFDVTQEDLEIELRNRWQASAPGGIHYSEPPGF